MSLLGWTDFFSPNLFVFEKCDCAVVARSMLAASLRPVLFQTVPSISSRDDNFLSTVIHMFYGRLIFI